MCRATTKLSIEQAIMCHSLASQWLVTSEAPEGMHTFHLVNVLSILAELQWLEEP
jgi:hypothetical protein